MLRFYFKIPHRLLKLPSRSLPLCLVFLGFTKMGRVFQACRLVLMDFLCVHIGMKGVKFSFTVHDLNLN